MVDLSTSKSYNNDAYPINCHQSTNLLGRVAPLITPDELVQKYLKGIDIKEWSEDDLKREIEYAANEFELMTGLDLVPTQYQQRIPFDRSLYKSFIHIKVDKKPISTLQNLSVVSADGQNIYTLPPQWIDAGLFHKGQINFVPLLSVFGYQQDSSVPTPGGTAANGSMIFLHAIQFWNWAPSFWTVHYTSSISKNENEVPIVCNDVVGMIAAIAILDAKHTQYRHNSTSIGQDGISQSSSSPGTQTYAPRIAQLMAKRDKMLSKIKAIYHSKYFVSNI